MLNNSECCCVYLTQKSFRCATFELFCKLYENEEYDNTLTPQSYIRKVIMNTIKAGKHLYLLIDFGSYAFTCDILESLQSICSKCGNLTTVVSVSSGYRMVSGNPLLLPQTCRVCKLINDTIRDSFDEHTLTGFTDEEATIFINHMNTNINIDDIKKLGGNNPLLLSHVKSSSDIGDYSCSVPKEIQSFLKNNLTIFKNIQSVSEYFATYQWQTGRLFIYLALQGEKFSSQELEYKFNTNSHGCRTINC